MRVVIFGATGRIGRPLLAEALKRGHEVVAFARDPGKLNLEHERLTVVAGDVLDAEAVEKAVVGGDAVLSVIGHAKGGMKDVQRRGTGNIVAAMEKRGVRRLVSLTGAGVRTEGDEPKPVDRLINLFMKTLERDVLEDAEEHVRVIQGSGLEWVIVRGRRLTEGEKKGNYRVALVVGKNSGTAISRADLADFMLDQVVEDAYLGRMPVVSY